MHTSRGAAAAGFLPRSGSYTVVQPCVCGPSLGAYSKAIMILGSGRTRGGGKGGGSSPTCDPSGSSILHLNCKSGREEEEEEEEEGRPL